MSLRLSNLRKYWKTLVITKMEISKMRGDINNNQISILTIMSNSRLIMRIKHLIWSYKNRVIFS